MQEINTVTLMNQVDDYLDGEVDKAELDIPADKTAEKETNDQGMVCNCG